MWVLTSALLVTTSRQLGHPLDHGPVARELGRQPQAVTTVSWQHHRDPDVGPDRIVVADPHTGQADDGAVGRQGDRLEGGEPDVDATLLCGPHPFDVPLAVLEVEVALWDQAHDAAQRRAEALDVLVRAVVVPGDDAIGAPRSRHLLLQPRPVRRRDGEIDGLDPLAIRLGVAPGRRERRASAVLAGGDEHLGEDALAARLSRSTLEVLEDARTDPPSPVTRVGDHVGVDDGGVVVQRQVGQAHADQHVVLEGPMELELEARWRRRERASRGLPGRDQVGPAMGLAGAPDVVPLAEPGLVAGVDGADLEHPSTLGERPRGAHADFREPGGGGRRRRGGRPPRWPPRTSRPRPSPGRAARCRMGAGARARCHRASPARGPRRR